MICKRIFYFLFYISFIYRSTFVLSDSTTAVPVETDSTPVVPSAAPTVSTAGAHVATPASPGAPIAGSNDTQGALVATPVTQGAQVATPVSNGTQHVAAPGTSGSQPVASHVAPGTQAITAPSMPGSHVVTTPVTPGSQPVVTHVAPGTQAMATVMMPGSHVVTTPASPGVPIAGSPVGHGAQVATQVTHSAPVSHSLSMPAAQVPNAGVASHTQSAFGDHAMGAPVAGSPDGMIYLTSGAPSTHSVTMTAPQLPTAAAPLTLTTPDAGTTAAMTYQTAGAQVATPVTHGTQYIDTSLSYGQPISVPMTNASPGSQGPQVSSPVGQASHIVATSAMDGAPVVTINIDGYQTGSNESKQPQKIQIDINDRQDSQFIKYRWINVNEGTDIYYARDGFIINEIRMNGNKRWPQPNEVKECKKVLYYTNPDNGRKTLRVLYADEKEAFDPDNPPSDSSVSSQGITDIDQSGSSSHLSSERTASYSDTAAGSHSLPLSPDSGSTATEPSLDDVLSSTDPNLLSTLSQQHVYKTDPNGQVYVEFTVAKGQESPDLASGSHSLSAFSVEEIHAPRAGQTIDYEDSDDEFTPGDDTPVDLTTYVTRVGRRVGELETRMDTAETTIKLLTRTLEYQHEILDFRRRFGAKTAPFGAHLGRQAFFDPEVFRPATSQVSKVLDASEHPSDIKLFVLDVSDSSKYVDLPIEKYEVKQEGDEIQYVFGDGVECKLVTYKDRSVWNHRGSEPHPTGLVFHPDDDKVVVDFEDAIVMFVKKGVLDGEDLSAGNHPKKSIIDIPLGKIESDDDAGFPKASEREKGTDDAANAASKVGVNGLVAEEVSNNASNEDPNVSTSLKDDSSSAIREPDQTASVPLTSHQTATVPAESPLSVAVPANGTTATPVPQTMTQPVTHTPAVPAGSPESTPVTHTPAVPAGSPESTPVTHTPAVPASSPENTPVTHAPAVPAGSPESTPVTHSSAPSAGQTADPSGFTLSSEQDPNDGAPTV